MTKDSPQPTSPGPFRADQIRPGDPYEVSNGHLVYGLPTEVILRDLLQRQGYSSLEDVRAQGESQCLRNAVVEVLTARGLSVDADLRTALANTKDPALLTSLLRQAATATTMAELLASATG